MKRRVIGFARREREIDDYQVPLKTIKKERQKKMNKRITSALRTKNIDALVSASDA